MQTVLSVPSAADISNVQCVYPDAKVFVLVEKDTKLSDCIITNYVSLPTLSIFYYVVFPILSLVRKTYKTLVRLGIV
jgi:hypothetical protein